MHITFPFLFSLFSMGLGVFLLITVGYLYYSSRNMDYWQVAQGTITKSAIKRTEASLSPDIEYRYSVQGTEYKGMFLTITLKQTFRMSTARDWISQYPVGKKVDVFYNPENVHMAVLEKGFSYKSALFMICTSIVFIIFGGFILFVLDR